MMEDSTLKFPGFSHNFLDINPLNSPTASKFGRFFLVLLTLGILTMPNYVDISMDPIDPFVGLQKMAKNTTNHVMVQKLKSCRFKLFLCEQGQDQVVPKKVKSVDTEHDKPTNDHLDLAKMAALDDRHQGILPK